MASELVRVPNVYAVSDGLALICELPDKRRIGVPTTQIDPSSQVQRPGDHGILVIPKQHVATLSDCGDAQLLGKMLALAPKLAAEHGCAVTVDADGERSGGFKTLINSGPDGGQEVYHLHLHMYGGPRPWRGMRL